MCLLPSKIFPTPLLGLETSTGKKVGMSVGSDVSVNTRIGEPTLLEGSTRGLFWCFLPVESVAAMATRQVTTNETEAPAISLDLEVGFTRSSCRNRVVHDPMLWRLRPPFPSLFEDGGIVLANASRSMSSNIVASGEEVL